MQTNINHSSQKPLLRVLRGDTVYPPPVWLMRQAGRYLPEYRAIRKKANNFLAMCYNPDLASQITMQPINRFKFDAAILFSDILVIPDALGVKVNFIEGKGPSLSPIKGLDGLSRLRPPNAIYEQLEPVSKTIQYTLSQLPPNVALIGFAGAPWTVATYMIAGQGEVGHKTSIKFLKEQPKAFIQLIDTITQATIEYLIMQIKAGVDVIKVFDSWAGSLSGEHYDQFVIQPNLLIINEIKKRYPEIPIITFPRLSGSLYAKFARMVQPDCLAVDNFVPIQEIFDQLQGVKCIQGNLPPNHLLEGKNQLKQATTNILNSMTGNPHIFNLGHGIMPQTPLENVYFLLDIIRGN